MTAVAERAPLRAFGRFAAPLDSARALDWKSQPRLLRGTLIAVDVVALAAALVTVSLVRAALDGVLPLYDLALEWHLTASIIGLPILLLVFWAQGLYDLEKVMRGTWEYARIAHSMTYGVVIILAASYFAGGGPLVSRSWVLLLWVLGILGAGLGRFVARRAVRKLRRRGVFRTRVAIIGASTFGVTIGQHLSAAEDEGLDIVGFLDEYLPLGQPLVDGMAVVGRPLDLLDQSRSQVADEYVLVPHALPQERVDAIMRLTAFRSGPALHVAVSSNDLLTHGVLLSERGSVPLLKLGRARISGLDVVLKRGLDVVGAAVLGLALAPTALLALARSFAAGRRPLLKEQRVYGSNGETVSLWLLETGATSWLPIRGVPALVSVLGGRLSLVGPRPELARSGQPPSAVWMTAAKPGLTGPWRLGGPDAKLADQATRDMMYLRNYSIWEDFRILWQSALRVARESGGVSLGRWQLPISNVLTNPVPSPD
jgi:lipopolysaccharide/colanic/teichoic acid biosynthesis glycosyltransferase